MFILDESFAKKYFEKIINFLIGGIRNIPEKFTKQIKADKIKSSLLKAKNLIEFVYD